VGSVPEVTGFFRRGTVALGLTQSLTNIFDIYFQIP
jgi:hypothetical protein